MSVKITGFDEMILDLQERFSKEELERISEKALIEASPEIVDRIKNNFQSFKDTGASIEEVKVKIVKMNDYEVKIKVYWEGPRNRWRLIHLNEKGYSRDGKRYNPKGKGAIARALRAGEEPYYRKIESVLRR